MQPTRRRAAKKMNIQNRRRRAELRKGKSEASGVQILQCSAQLRLFLASVPATWCSTGLQCPLSLLLFPGLPAELQTEHTADQLSKCTQMEPMLITGSTGRWKEHHSLPLPSSDAHKQTIAKGRCRRVCSILWGLASSLLDVLVAMSTGT